jgi:hypothetical protein
LTGLELVSGEQTGDQLTVAPGGWAVLREGLVN